MITKLSSTRRRLDLNYSERDRQPQATYAIQLACQLWNKSHVRGHVRLVRAASSNYATKIQNTQGRQLIDHQRPHTLMCLTRTKHLRIDPALIPLKGLLHRKQKISYA